MNKKITLSVLLLILGVGGCTFSTLTFLRCITDWNSSTFYGTWYKHPDSFEIMVILIEIVGLILLAIGIINLLKLFANKR